MESVEREYDYRPKWTVVFLAGGFFLLCTLVLGLKAANNDRGLILNRIIELGPEGATVFYWVLTGLSAAFVVAALVIAVQRVLFKHRLALGRESLIVPKSAWSHESVPGGV